MALGNTDGDRLVNELRQSLHSCLWENVVHALGRRQLDALRWRLADTMEGSMLSNLGVGLHIGLGNKLVDNLGR